MTFDDLENYLFDAWFGLNNHLDWIVAGKNYFRLFRCRVVFIVFIVFIHQLYRQRIAREQLGKEQINRVPKTLKKASFGNIHQRNER